MVLLKIDGDLYAKVKSFCDLNELNVEEFVYICFKKGFDIERYGLINDEKTVDVSHYEKTIDILKSEIDDIKKSSNKLNSELSLCSDKRKMLEDTLLTLKTELGKYKKNE